MKNDLESKISLPAATIDCFVWRSSSVIKKKSRRNLVS